MTAQSFPVSSSCDILRFDRFQLINFGSAPAKRVLILHSYNSENQLKNILVGISDFKVWFNHLKNSGFVFQKKPERPRGNWRNCLIRSDRLLPDQAAPLDH